MRSVPTEVDRTLPSYILSGQKCRMMPKPISPSLRVMWPHTQALRTIGTGA